MKAILNPDGSFRGTVPDGVETRPSATRSYVPPGDTPDFNPWTHELIDRYDIGPVSVVHTYEVRARAVPVPRVWSALEFDTRVETISPGAWGRLEDVSVNTLIPKANRSRVKAAIRRAAKAVQIESDDPQTIAFLDAAVALGVVTSEEKTRVLTER